MLRRILVTFAATLLLGTTAWAQSPTPAAERDARERFQRGVELTDEGAFSAAMAEFRRAYELTHNAQVLFNISATHEALTNFVEAYEAMRQYEQLAPPTVIARRRADIDAALARLQNRIGTIVVALDVEGLVVRIDNIERPAARARAGILVPSGRHRVALSAAGHEPRESDHDVAAGTRVEIREPLRRIHSTIAVESIVEHAEVVVDGRVVGRTPLASPIPVDEGLRSIEVRRDGYQSYTTAVNATGTGARITARLEWLASMPITVGVQLTLRVSETTALAYVDGRRIEINGTERVPPGPHRLRVERQDYLPFERDVNFTAGHPETVEVLLVPIPAYRENRLAAAGAQRRVAWFFTILGGGVAVSAGITLGFFLERWSAWGRDDDALGRDSTMCGGSTMCNVTPTLNQSLFTDRTIPGNVACSNLRPGPMNMTSDVAACSLELNTQRVYWGNLSWIPVAAATVGLFSFVAGLVLHANVPDVSRLQRNASSGLLPRLRPVAGDRTVGLALDF